MFADILARLQDTFRKYPYMKPLLISIVAIIILTYLYLSFYVVRIVIETPRQDMKVDSLEIKAFSSDSSRTFQQASKNVSSNLPQILPRSFDYFEATSKEYATIQSAQNHNWWPYKTIRIKLAPQKELQKISTSGGACPVTSKSGTTYTYRCGNPRYLFSHNTTTTPWSIDSKNLLSTYKIVTPYKEGLLGVRSTGSLTVTEPFTYIEPDSGERSNLKSPKKIANIIKNIGNITTDSSDKTSPYAVLSDNTKQKFYVINIDKAEVVSEVDYPKDTYTQKSNVSCYMAHKKAACYVGRYTASAENTPHAEHEDHEGHEEPKEPKKSAVVVFDADRQSQPTQISADSYIKQIVLGEKGRVFAIDTWGNLVELMEGNKQRLIARSVSQMNYVDKLVFIANDRLYRYDTDTRQSHLVFQSDSTSLSTVTSYGQQFISLFATDGKTTSPNTYIFQISDKDYLPSLQGARLVDLLTLYKDTESVDYYDDNVEIVLKLIPDKTPILYYRPDGSGAVTYDQATVEKAQSDMTDKIKGLGINTQNLKIDYLF